MQKHILLTFLLAVVVFSFFLYGKISLVDAASVDTPVLRSPANHSNPLITEDGGTITLDWDAVQNDWGIQRYEVKVIREGIVWSLEDVENPEDDAYIKMEPYPKSFSVLSPTTERAIYALELGMTQFSPDQIYRWQVRACTANCNDPNARSEWSEQRTFIPKLKKPSLTEPINRKLVLFSPQHPITFQWGEITSADSYELNIVYGDNRTNYDRSLSPIGGSNSGDALGFSIFKYLLQKFVAWTITPSISSQELFFTELGRLFPGDADNIPSDSISSQEEFTVRFMPPNPVYPAHGQEVEILYEEGQDGIKRPLPVELKWDPLLYNTPNTTYEVRKPDSDGTEQFVGFSTNTLSVPVSELNEMCAVNTWEVRSCIGGINNPIDCGPYPSDLSKPLDYGIQPGPWEFTLVPTFTVVDLETSFPQNGVRGEVEFTATIGGLAEGIVSIDFGDGKNGGDTAPYTEDQLVKIKTTHKYTSSGTYTITIKRGCAAPIEISKLIDIVAPRVDTFRVEPELINQDSSNANVRVSWEVSDTGGSGIEQIEVWRAYDVSGNKTVDELEGSWQKINSITISGEEIFFTDDSQKQEGVYWYGIHVKDVSGSCITEAGGHCVGGVSADSLDQRPSKGPKRVEVSRLAPGAPKSFNLEDTSSFSYELIRYINKNDLTFTGTGVVGNTIKILRGVIPQSPTTEISSDDGKWSLTLANQSEGTRTYTARAVDAAGNTSDSNELTVVIDTIDPIVSSFVSDPKKVLNSNSPITFTWTVSDYNLRQVDLWRADFNEECSSGEEGECSWDRVKNVNGEDVIVLAPGGSKWICTSDCAKDSPPDGNYWYGLHVLDYADRKGFQPSPINILVDRSSPAISCTNSKSRKNDSGFHVSCNFDEASPDGADIYYTTDGTEPNDSSLQYDASDKPYIEGSDQTIIFKAIGYDSAGNPSGIKEEWYVFGPVLPVEITGKPSNPSSDDRPTFYFSIPVGASNIQCSVGRNNYISCDSSSSHTVPSSLGEGEHTFYVRASNEFGYTYDSYSWMVNFIPTIMRMEVSPDPVLPNSSISFKAFWSETANDSVKLFVCQETGFIQGVMCLGGTWCKDVIPTTSSPSDCSYPTKKDDIGEHNYRAYVCDEENTCSGVKSGTFTVSEDARPPVSPPGRPPTVPPSGVPSATPGMCENYCKALSGDEEFDIATEQAALGNTTCICNPLGTVSFSDIINRILGFLFNIAIVLAPIMGVIAGIMFVTATGDPGQIAKAKSILLWTAVGFVVILVSRGFIAVIGGIIGL